MTPVEVLIYGTVVAFVAFMVYVAARRVMRGR